MTTVTKDMLIWHDDTCGIYKTPKGYVLIEYSTGNARWMTTSAAKHFMKVNHYKEV